MATLGANGVKSKNGDVRLVHGRFVGGTAAVSAVANSGSSWTIARSGAGVYVLTFDSGTAFQKFMGGGCAIMDATALLKVSITAYSIASRTVTFTVTTATTGAAIDLTAAQEVWFSFNMGWSVRS